MRVQPEHELLDAEIEEEISKQPLLSLFALRGRVVARELWDGDDKPIAHVPDAQPRSSHLPEDWLLNEEDATLASTAREELLRTLPDEIPAQVGDADEIERSHAMSGRTLIVMHTFLLIVKLLS